MLVKLPIEIVILVVHRLYNDVEALRNTSLVCRDLLPFVREELFRVMSAYALKEEYMHSYYPLVHEMQLVEPIPPKRGSQVDDSPNPDRFVQYLRSGILPNLQAVNFIDISPWFHIGVHLTFFANLSLLTSVTTLTLSCLFLKDLQQAQMLICSFSSLTSLSLKMVRFSGSAFVFPSYVRTDYTLIELATTRPRLTRLAVMPEFLPGDGTSAILDWLVNGPSRRSLTTLLVPYETESPGAVLKRIGPSINIEHLSVPLKALGKSADGAPLARYTNLLLLTLFLGSAVEDSEGWRELAPLLEHGVASSSRLRSLRISVRLDTIDDAAVDWGAIAALNNTLSAEHEFGALERVEVLVQWKERERRSLAGEALDLESNIIKCMNKLAAARKLIVYVGPVKEFDGFIPGRPATHECIDNPYLPWA
ncbi:hypothetical protein C8Q77DRAFT_334867 [Trametes polyzona]|nr:hypothetical protein C8Q77DRAFT_334867 [Trametes polyzona]